MWAHEFGRAERRESGKMGWEIKYFAGRKTLGQRFLLLAIQYTVISGIANYQPKNLLYRVPIALDSFAQKIRIKLEKAPVFLEFGLIL